MSERWQAWAEVRSGDCREADYKLEHVRREAAQELLSVLDRAQGRWTCVRMRELSEPGTFPQSPRVGVELEFGAVSERRIEYMPSVTPTPLPQLYVSALAELRARAAAWWRPRWRRMIGAK